MCLLEQKPAVLSDDSSSCSKTKLEKWEMLNRYEFDDYQKINLKNYLSYIPQVVKLLKILLMQYDRSSKCVIKLKLRTF